jgi:glyoxylase-like metal-dependent hydrolase (beta-lactamase superfamily II)
MGAITVVRARSRLAAVLAAGLVAAGLTFVGARMADAAAAAEPLLREGVTARLSEHVYSIPDNSVPMVPNVGIVVGSRATLVVDTGMGIPNAQAILREVAKVSKNTENYLVTTHFHPEHDLGAHGFPADWKMIRSRDEEADIAEFGLQMAELFSSRSPFVAGLLKDAKFRPADISFDKEHSLDLGGVQVRIVAMGANHTRGDTAILAQPDGVLFSGDVVMKPLPAFASPYSRLSHWLASLDVLQAMTPKVIVPSHGPVGGPELIGDYRDYLIAVRDRTAAAKRGGASADEAVKTLTGELVGRYPNEGRLGGAIRAAYAEAP